MVFPQGDRFWEGRLYPGAAVLARRARVPLIPVGLENAYIYEPDAEKRPVVAGFLKGLGQTLRKRWIAVHFAPPIFPDSQLPEEKDVDRMMRELERAFARFYREFYNMPGPVWVNPKRAE